MECHNCFDHCSIIIRIKSKFFFPIQINYTLILGETRSGSIIRPKISDKNYGFQVEMWHQMECQQFTTVELMLVGGWTNPFETYERQNGNLPPGRGENKKMKPPPSNGMSQQMLESSWKHYKQNNQNDQNEVDYSFQAKINGVSWFP